MSGRPTFTVDEFGALFDLDRAERDAVETVLLQLRMKHGLQKLSRIEDLLTERERTDLHEDLARMARQRRRAFDESAGVSLP